MPIPYQKSHGGTNTTPTEFQLTNNLSFKEGNETRMLIQSNGHLAVSQDVHLYDSSNISTGTLKYSLGVSSDGNSFQVVNEVTNTVIFDASNATPYYDKTYVDSEFARMTAQNLYLVVKMNTKLPLDVLAGETSADDRYVRSTTLAGYSDTTAMNSAISTALSSYSNTTAMNTAIASHVDSRIVSQSNTHAFFYPHAFAIPNHSAIQVGDLFQYTG